MLLRPHWRLVLAAFLGWFLDAFDQVALLLVLPEIGAHFGVSLTAMGLVITAQSVGRIFGNIGWGWLADRYGRKLTFMLGVIWFAAFFRPVRTCLELHGAARHSTILRYWFRGRVDGVRCVADGDSARARTLRCLFADDGRLRVRVFCCRWRTGTAAAAFWLARFIPCRRSAGSSCDFHPGRHPGKSGLASWPRGAGAAKERCRTRPAFSHGSRRLAGLRVYGGAAISNRFGLQFLSGSAEDRSWFHSQRCLRRHRRLLCRLNPR